MAVEASASGETPTAAVTPAAAPSARASRRVTFEQGRGTLADTAGRHYACRGTPCHRSSVEAGHHQRCGDRAVVGVGHEEQLAARLGPDALDLVGRLEHPRLAAEDAHDRADEL